MKLINTDRLFLREMTPDDCQALFQVSNQKRSRSGSALLFNGSGGPDVDFAISRPWPVSRAGSEGEFLRIQSGPSSRETDESDKEGRSRSHSRLPLSHEDCDFCFGGIEKSP